MGSVSDQILLTEELSSLIRHSTVIGIGGAFALLMLGITWIQNRYTSFSTAQAEEFNTASRSVKPGLIASGIVSSWCAILSVLLYVPGH